MSSSIESEDLDNVPLVRMEDVQPSRVRTRSLTLDAIEDNYETCFVDDIEFDNECIVNDDEGSNFGTVVSVSSVELIEDAEEDDEEVANAEMIVPDVVETVDEPVLPFEPKQMFQLNAPDSWPILEILPGGVIKNSDKLEDTGSEPEESNDVGPMVYACAKCPQSFKFLFCLVKHVKWHENEQKKLMGEDIVKLKPQKSSKYVCLHTTKKRMIIPKSNRKKSPKIIKVRL